jgi:hypothetical protein
MRCVQHYFNHRVSRSYAEVSQSPGSEITPSFVPHEDVTSFAKVAKVAPSQSQR